MPLRSRHFARDLKLEACLSSDPAHVLTGASGDHVGKIQVALQLLDGLVIDQTELTSQRYGPSTAAGVLAFKQKRAIVNRSYQSQPDNIVGKMTIAALDDEMLRLEQTMTLQTPGAMCRFNSRTL